MAGVKGKSGGARPNTGGARPGAGRKPKPKAPEAGLTVGAPALDPLAFLLAVQNDPKASPALRVRAAIAAAQYVHLKKKDGGKRDDEVVAAKKASTGKYAAAAPPLRVVGRR